MPYADAEYEYFEQRQLPARPIQPGLQPLLQHTDYKRPQDETLYAEPILINHHVNTSNPLGNLSYLSNLTSFEVFLECKFLVLIQVALVVIKGFPQNISFAFENGLIKAIDIIWAKYFAILQEQPWETKHTQLQVE